jgi:hypothetical protein
LWGEGVTVKLEGEAVLVSVKSLKEFAAVEIRLG